MSGEVSTNSQQFNPLTGDIQFNPASWGLNMRDIEAASLNLRTAIYSGNINLTADFFQQVKALSDKKYNAIDPDGAINTTRLSDTDMVNKDAGLYMNHQRLGFWNGTEWKAFIGNNGNFAFDGDVGNYIRWDGTDLTIQGNLLLPGGETVAEAIAGVTVDASWDAITNKPDVLASVSSFTPPVSGAGFKLSNTHMGYYSDGVWKTYMQSNGNFGLSGTGSNGLTWNGTTLNITGNITMTGGSVTWSAVTGSGKPADNATVGADWNTNISNKPTIPTVPGYITSTKITGTSIESCTLTGNTLNTTINTGDQVACHVSASNGNGFYVEQFGYNLMASLTAIDDGGGYRGVLNFYDGGNYCGRIGGVSGTGLYIEANVSLSYGSDFSVGSGGSGTAYMNGKLKIPVGTNLY